MTAKILCVEENPSDRRWLRKILGTAGYQLLEVSNAQIAIALSTWEKPDLILMEVGVSIADGCQMIGQLKGSRELIGIPVIAVSANAMHGDREYYIATGFDWHLSKPIVRNELLNTVAHFLGNS